MCGGQVAVESFYMISGFYMALVLNEKYIGVGSYKRFITSRFLRIFPLYWIVLLLTGVFCVIGLYCYNKPFYLGSFINNSYSLSGITICYFVFENLVVIGQDLLYFLRLDDLFRPEFTYHIFSYKHVGYQYLLVPQAWSISIEFLFYLIAPFLVTKKVKWQILLILAGIGAKLFFANIYYLSFDPWTYRCFPLEIPWFIAGSLAYRYYKVIENKVISNAIGYVLLATCIFVLFTIAEINIEEQLINSIFYLFLLCSLPYIFKAFKNSAIDRYIGELSFSIYICHHLVLCLYRDYFFSHKNMMVYYGYLAVFSTLVLSIIIQQTLVKPIERYRAQKKY